jgi:transcriptional regulator with XRE-family HTH domain
LVSSENIKRFPEREDMSETRQRLHDFSEYVRRVMKVKGLTQKDVQRMSGGRITDGYVASITTGRATNLSVEKIKALADGLGVDADTLFHVACGVKQEPGDGRKATVTDPMMILETVQKVVASPDVTEILHEVVRMSPEERASLLLSIRRIGSARSKSQPKAKRT